MGKNRGDWYEDLKHCLSLVPIVVFLALAVFLALTTCANMYFYP